MAPKIRREPGKLEGEPIPRSEADPAWWRPAPISEPERPTRWVWIILGVTVVFAAIACGGYYYGFSRQRQVPAAVQVVPPLNAAAKPTGAGAPAIHPAPQLAVGLKPLIGQQKPDEPATAPVSAQSPPPVPNEPPKFASGLRPITEQVPPPDMPQPPAEAAAPIEPPPAPLPQPRPVRKAAPPQSAAPGAPPSAPTGIVKF